MTAKEAISPVLGMSNPEGLPQVEGEMPLLEVLPRLLDSPVRRLEVTGSGEKMGIIDESSYLDALGRMIAARDDSSVITVECAPGDYSASRLSHAVEDTDAHLVDLLTAPGSDGNLIVTLRVRSTDPSAAVGSLERYGYHVVEAHGDWYSQDDAMMERLLGLKALMDV